MSEKADISGLSEAEKKVLAEKIRKLKESKGEETRSAGPVPIAIIGMGCRFPGAPDLDAYWRLLAGGVDAVSEVPRSRWDINSLYDPDSDAPGKMATRWGGFLSNVYDFDAAFFGISATEAERLDPQQRLMLEVSWEALERAGISPSDLRDSKTATFMGISGRDYLALQCHDPNSLNVYSATGGNGSCLAGRLSYFLGLKGPSLSIDASCASALASVHLAVQSLRNGECGMALAGGTNLLLSPEYSIMFSNGKMNSPDGRCKTFSDDANGYVRAEGIGVVILKRLSEAVADGDPVLAVLRGSAINHSGASGGLTVPSLAAQQEVIRQALRNGGLKPREVGYIEAHGTGTPLGDPIEFGALTAVFAEGRDASNPLHVSSVKTNFGHSEAASGVAGLIKVVLALQNRKLPPHLHLKKVNHHIDLNAFPVVIPQTLIPFPAIDGKRVAGVSSFGFSGMNAHAVIEEYQPLPGAAEQGQGSPERPRHLLALSARSNEGLASVVDQYLGVLSSADSGALPDICFTAAVGRAHFETRLAVHGAEPSTILHALQLWKKGEKTPALFQGEVPNLEHPRVAFLFSGQGAQYAGMGKSLYETQPVFRKWLDECAKGFNSHLEKPLLQVIFEDGELLNSTRFTQPALFALEYALHQLWKSWGIEPTAVIGHSVGEIVAACVAGVFNLEDAIRLVANRARLMARLPAGGAMASLQLGEEDVKAAIAGHSARVSIAGLNGPESTVISGESAAVREIISALTAKGIKTKELSVSHAFHSAAMDPILDEFERVASEVKYSVPGITLISNLTGRKADSGEVTRPGYWRRHLREAVRFGDGIQALVSEGYRCFLEVGPGTTLSGMGSACVGASEDFTWLNSLKKDTDDWTRLFDALAALYVRGAKVAWKGLDLGYRKRKRVLLPTYPFQRKKHFFAPNEGGRVDARRTTPTLLGTRVLSPALKDNVIVFESEISPESMPALQGHQICGLAVMPVAACVDAFFSAARSSFQGAGVSLEGVTFEQPLAFSAGEHRIVQVVLTGAGEDRSCYGVQLLSRSLEPAGATNWLSHVTARLQLSTTGSRPATQDTLESIRARCTEALPVAAHYDALRRVGIVYGPQSELLTRISRGKSECLGEISTSENFEELLQTFSFPPSLLDASFQLTRARPGLDLEALQLPVNLEKAALFGRPQAAMLCHAVFHSAEPGEKVLKVDLTLFDGAGGIVAEILGLSTTVTTREAFLRTVNEARVRQKAGPSIEILPALRAASAEKRPELLSKFITSEVKMVLGVEPGSGLDPKKNFISMGMDSLGSVRLRNAIKRGIGVHLGELLPTALVLTHPTVEAICAFLTKEILTEENLARSAPEKDASRAEGISEKDRAALAWALNPKNSADPRSAQILSGFRKVEKNSV